MATSLPAASGAVEGDDELDDGEEDPQSVDAFEADVWSVELPLGFLALRGDFGTPKADRIRSLLRHEGLFEDSRSSRTSSASLALASSAAPMPRSHPRSEASTSFAPSSSPSAVFICVIHIRWIA